MLLALTGANVRAEKPRSMTRVTLSNGLQIVIVPDRLAPVASVVMTYRAGSNEQQYPGQAHALEHMMFRGTPSVSSAQLYEIGQLLGGRYNAQTKPSSTFFYFTIPSRYLDVALRIEADRARALTLSPSAWGAERGAIEQEIATDESDPFGKLERRTILPAIFAGTPYAKDGLGTKFSFDRQITAKVLQQFYQTWYRPNNAVLVIAGDITPAAAIASARKYFGNIVRRNLPKREPVNLRNLSPVTYHVTTDYPATVVALAFRSPGWGDKDYAAMQVLEAVLNSQRADLFGLVARGQAFAAVVGDAESQQRATASFLFGVIPSAAKPDVFLAALEKVVADYQNSGVPADLVAVAKRRALASKEFEASSIEGLAIAWSDAVAVTGKKSPDEQIAAIDRVNVADVNRVLRRYLDRNHMITVLAVPGSAGKISLGATGGGKENNATPPQKQEPLPAWAARAFSNLSLPMQPARPVAMTLSNGMRLIVQASSVTRTVWVSGNVVTNQARQAAVDKQGVEDVLNGLFPFGSQRYDRLQTREQLDAIAAEMQAGTDFSLSVRSADFDRGVQLLAEDELHPSLPADAFQVVKTQVAQALAGEASTPQHLADVALSEALYPAGDPERVHATTETVGGVSLDDVKSYYANVFRPDMTNVVIVGDVTPQQARATFEKYFASWHATGPAPEVALPAVPRNAAKAIDVADATRVQAQVQLAQVFSVGRRDPDWAALTVGNTALGGGGFGSMLMDDLRTRAGLVYSTDSQLDSYRNRSVFTIDFSADPAKVGAAQRMAMNDLRALEEGGVDLARLQRAKTMLISDIPLRAQSFAGIADELLEDSNFGLPLDQATIDARREMKASPSSVRQAFRKWISPAAFVRVIISPAKSQ